MDRFKSVFVCCLLLVGSSACAEAEDPSLAGTYEITSHTRNDSSCDGEGDAVEGEPGFFEFVEGDLFGVPMLLWHDCESEESCGDGNLERSFINEEGEWFGGASYANAGAEPSTCDLEIISATMERTDAGLRVEFRTQEGLVGVPCDTDTAEVHADELPCTGIEVFVANAL